MEWTKGWTCWSIRVSRVLWYNSMWHHQSFVGRDYKAWCQRAVFILHPYLTVQELDVLLKRVTKVYDYFLQSFSFIVRFSITYCAFFKPTKECQLVCTEFIDSVMKRCSISWRFTCFSTWWSVSICLDHVRLLMQKGTCACWCNVSFALHQVWIFLFVCEVAEYFWQQVCSEQGHIKVFCQDSKYSLHLPGRYLQRHRKASILINLELLMIYLFL